MRNKVEQLCRYNLVKCNIKGSFDIFDGISDYFTLVKLIDSYGRVNSSVSITGSWIYDTNYKRAFPLMR